MIMTIKKTLMTGRNGDYHVYRFADDQQPESQYQPAHYGGACAMESIPLSTIDVDCGRCELATVHGETLVYFPESIAPEHGYSADEIANHARLQGDRLCYYGW